MSNGKLWARHHERAEEGKEGTIEIGQRRYIWRRAADGRRYIDRFVGGRSQRVWLDPPPVNDPGP